jgi:hypothetical protein
MTSSKLQILSALLFNGFFLLVSCKGEIRDKEYPSLETYQLEKESEFSVNSLTNLELLDYFPKDKIYLGYSTTGKGKEIILVDESGQILINQNLQGEGPEQHSSNLSSLGFSETGNIWVMTGVEVLLYNQSLKLIERFKYQPGNVINLYSVSKKFSYHKNDSNSTNISFATIPSGTSIFHPKSYENFDQANLFEIYNQKTKSKIEFSPLNERQVTKDFLEIAGGFYGPVYFIDSEDSKLYLTATFDNEITIYDLSQQTMIDKITIYYADPRSVKLYEKLYIPDLAKTSKGWLETPKNYSIFKLDNGLFALEYNDKVSLNPNLTNQSEIFENIYQNKMLLFDQTGQLSKEITIPTRGMVMTGLPRNRLLIKLVYPDIEADFTHFEIYKIVKSENS